jgi:WD40 repeat protein
VQIKVYEPLKRSKIRLFDGLKNVDEEMTGLFVQRKKPYLSVKERAYLERAVSEEDAKGWQGTTLHMDFDLTETATIIEAIKAACAELYVSRYRGRPQKMLASATKGQLAAIAAYAAEDDRLAARTRHSIKSFLHDTKSGQTTLQAYRLRLASVAKHPISERVASSGQLLNRELGLRSRKHNPRRKIRDAIYETMSVTRTFTGASGDVGNLAWSKDGRYFAAGSACLVDPSSMQYNQPNNLLFGNQDTLYELPDHHRPREKPTQGVNATHSMHVSQDSRLFETVSMVEFSRDGDKLFSVGYDDHLRVYSIEGGRCSLLSSLNHSTKIDLLDVNKYHKVLATGSQSIGSSIKVFGYSPEGIQNVSSFTSKRAQTLIERRIMPSALRWGDAPAVSGYLLAGFASASIDSSAQSAYGELCLWDVEKQMQIQVAPAAGNIFDANWNPASSHVAAACAAIGMNFNRGTNSVVRVYNALQDATGLKWTSRGLEMECPALDINDVLFNPYNDRQVAAGATDGSVYVWDLRRSDETLHRFSHGEPVMPLDPNWSREAFDTGVRFCAWGDRAARLYTGSSDGVVKVWDTACSGHDAHVKDVATFNSGVMSGAFTEDFSRLLIGEVNGSINLVEIAADPVPRTELEKFTLVPCDVPSTSSVSATELDVDSGIALSQQLVAECKIEIKPFGGLPKSQAVRGPNYTGPFDYSDSAERNRHKALALQNLYRVEGPQCKHLACKEAGRHFSNPNGDVEDSERSRDRIPQAMRDAVTTSGNTGRQKKERMPTTTLTCMHCSAPARVREENLSQAAFPLCERCSFACLRCGMACRKISPKVERVTCSSCGGVWDIGVLRYTAVSKGSRGRREEGSGVVMAEKEGVPLANEADEGPLGKLGDLLDLVGEWHHSLWGSEPLGSG